MASRIADLSFFNGLSRGGTVDLYQAQNDFPVIHWIHDRVERDIVWGRFDLPDGRQFKLDAYLYNNGDAVSFGTGSHLDEPHGFGLYGGSVFLEPPLSSQFPQRFNPGKYIPNPKFSFDERKALTDYCNRFLDIGFDVDHNGGSPRSLFVDVPSGCFDLSLDKEEISISICIRKYKGERWWSRSHYGLYIDDCSHRRGLSQKMSFGGTTVVRKEFQTLGNTLEAMLNGIDQVVLRAR